jgi:hypothetical protein
MKRSTVRWLAALALLTSLLVVGGIAWWMGWRAGTREQVHPAPPTTALASSPTPADTATAGPTALPEASPTATRPKFSFPGELGHSDTSLYSLTIVHTNDTWGYTRPCG